MLCFMPVSDRTAASKKRLRRWVAFLLPAACLALAALAMIALLNQQLAAALARADAAEARVQALETAAKERAAETQAVLEFVESRLLIAARPKDQEGGLGAEVRLRDALRAAVPHLKMSFAQHPLLEARVRMVLGFTFSYLGETASAAEQFEAARALCQERLGKDNPATLFSMSSLAASYAALGRHEEAMRLREETHELRKAKLGPEHGETLWSKYSLASSYATLGRLDDAHQLYEETLKQMAAQRGADHPDTLKCLAGLAGCRYALGRYPEALKLLEEALASMRAKLGPEHPDTLFCLTCLASCLSALGKHAEALQVAEAALDAKLRKLGPEHPDTFISMNNVAWLLAAAPEAKASDAVKAVDLAKRATAGSPRTPNYWGTLGTARFRSGDWAGAVADLEKAQSLRAERDSANAYGAYVLAMAKWRLGEKEQARTAFAQGEAARAKRKRDDPALLRLRDEAAGVLGQ